MLSAADIGVFCPQCLSSQLLVLDMVLYGTTTPHLWTYENIDAVINRLFSNPRLRLWIRLQTDSVL